MAELVTKLGKIIDPEDHTVGRDAVHVATIAMFASANLKPGQKVGIVDMDRELAGPVRNPIHIVGIVDPFLESTVQKGERFHLCLKPGTITGLRHLWTHDAFPDAPADAGEKLANLVDGSNYLRTFATRWGFDFDFLMEAADKMCDLGDHTYENTESYKEVPSDEWKEFWIHFRKRTGKIPADTWVQESSPFTCSC